MKGNVGRKKRSSRWRRPVRETQAADDETVDGIEEVHVGVREEVQFFISRARLRRRRQYVR